MGNWKGYVNSEIYNGTFDVIVSNKDYPEIPQELWTIYVDRVPIEERKYIRLGAFLTIIIDQNRFDIVFNKEVYTKEDIEEINKEANRYNTIFNTEG
jgi:protein tyrosine phosphatase